jgi:hypothetical protein
MNSIALLSRDTGFADWLTQLKAMFPVADEYELAAAIYSFAIAYEDGLSPQQAYDAFDAWVAA